MNKGKWVLAGILLFIIILIRLLMSNFGWQISHGVSRWLTLAGIALIIVVVIPKDYKRYALWFAVIFLSLALSTIRKERKDAKDNITPENQCQTVKIVQENPSEAKQTSWGYVIEFNGREFEGVKVLAVEKDTRVRVRWIPGGKIHNPEDSLEPHRTNPWGYDDYVRGWKERFRFGWRAGVKPHAVLALIKPSGDTLDSVREDGVLYFDKRTQQTQIQFWMHSGEELMLYYHDINDPWYFQRNGIDGSFLRFEIEIF